MCTCGEHTGHVLQSCITVSHYLFLQDGWTALQVAYEQGHDEVVQTLMIAKSDLNLLNVSTSDDVWAQ